MTDGCCDGPRLGRRAFLRGSGAAALALPLLPVLADVAAAQPPLIRGVEVRARQDWARGLGPTGPLEQERPGDVRFLLIHHTASSNRYDAADVPSLIRGFHEAHTGPAKGWPDVAYNFFVDRYGTVWEGRAGSLAGPVKPDATGGSQGFAQLCCFIGDHQVDAPTGEARRSMTALLAAVADAYAVDTAPGATTTFVSRGSNRWARGRSVTTATIAGHRDMSRSVCPGDAAYRLVTDVFPADVTAARAGGAAVVGAPASTAPASTAPASTAPVAPAPVAPASVAPVGQVPVTSGEPPAIDRAPAPAVTAADGLHSPGQELLPTSPAAITGGVLAAGAAGLLVRMVVRQRVSPSPVSPSPVSPSPVSPPQQGAVEK